MSTNEYYFVDHWYVPGTVQEVADVLSSAPDLARWWPSTYLDVQVLQRGDERSVGEVGTVYAKGWLPYRIRFNYRVVEEHYPHGFTVEAFGDLTGRGVWTFEQMGPTVHVQYEWTVRADKPLIRAFSFILKRLFRSNHLWTMRLGEESLRLELARRRAKTPSERDAIPPPPDPPTLAPWHVGLLLAGATGVAVWLATRPPQMRVEYSTVIRRPVDEVFNYVTQVENDLHWQPEISEVTVTSNGQFGVGSTFREVRTAVGRPFTWDMRVTEFDPPHRITIVSDGGTVPYSGSRVFEAVDGGTRITETSEVELAPWFRPFRQQIAAQSRQSVERAYSKLKAILETS
jgi:uncharacterized protein YndB with AHSA1/START domain